MQLKFFSYTAFLFLFGSASLHAETSNMCGITKVSSTPSGLSVKFEDLSAAVIKRLVSKSTVTVVNSNISRADAEKIYHGLLEFSDHIVLDKGDYAVINVSKNEICSIRAVLEDGKLAINVKDDNSDPDSGSSLVSETTMSPN